MFYAPVIQILVEELAQDLLSKGRISKDQMHEDKSFLDRLTHLDREFPNASVWLHKQPFQMPAAFQDLWTHSNLLGIAQQMIGPDISGHPVWNLRTKVPAFDQATVPWHQDTAYLHEGCWSVLQPAAWVPLVDTNEENGCLRLVKGGHRSGKTAVHTCCVGGTWYIDLDQEVCAATLRCARVAR
jgi:ectoine hydroxylase-related dioxygenase (phytanoyl-CoA dioxygenase family)